jgi:hypothetical protein
VKSAVLSATGVSSCRGLVAFWLSGVVLANADRHAVVVVLPAPSLMLGLITTGPLTLSAG